MSGTLSEHYSYISEPRRNAAYRDAIGQAVRPGDLVADLGCGFGVLGLFCLEAGAAHVWGIDRTEAIDIAAETMARQGLAERYTCIRESTFRASLPQPVDLLICDHVGYFGVDYGIVALVEDARRRLLKPGGRVIPEALDLWIAGIASTQARSVLDAWESEAVPPAYHWLTSYAANAKNDVNFAYEELATRPVALGTVDLTQDSPDLLAFAATIIADADGALDGLDGWFSCRLVPGVTMTNAPDSPDRIARGQVLLGFEHPLEVMAGDTVKVSVRIRHDDGIISWVARNPRTGQRERQSTFASLPVPLSGGESAAHEPRHLSPEGMARADLLALIDGSRTAAEIEAEMLRRHNGLFPTEAELVRFVRAELARSSR